MAAVPDPPTGLTQVEATRRLAADGPNEIVEPHRGALRELLTRFWGPIPWMIEAALVLSLVVGRWADAAIIGALLVMNGIVSFWEEHQAGNAIAALEERLANTARVRRDGEWRTVEARELVAGDLVHLGIGDVVPADASVSSGTDLAVDQSALTGESLPVTRHRREVVYSGSIVTRGAADALVVATGPRTYFGRTATLVAGAGTTSHFQRAIMRIARYLMSLALVLVAVILAVGIGRGNDATEMLEFALVIAIASIPVALPAVLSVTMAVGASTLAREQAVVTRLAAVEELGSVDVLCSDKTGTLTENQLELGPPACAPGVDVDRIVRVAAWTCRPEGHDPIDRAVLDAAGRITEPDVARVVDFEPFDPVRKLATATVVHDGVTERAAKGAPQVVLDLVGDPEAARAARAAIDDFARRGWRALGVAAAEADGPWRLLGVVPLADPPRVDAAATLTAARDLGVEVKMVTGDQLPIAAEIARTIGLGDDIHDADSLGDDLPDDAAAALVERTDGFAQVFPEHKFRIVELLQRRGHVVGMTGDGVNDAPALKQADAGIAVSGATDAARAAADIVLLAPGLSVIVRAIRTSREIFQRMTSYAIYRIAETIRVLLFVSASIVVFDVFPVTAVMIVLLALLNDAAILAIAYDHATAPARPATWEMRRVLTVATVLGLAGVVASFLLLVIARDTLGLDMDTTRTMMYLKLSVAGHLTIFITRTRGPFWSDRPSRLLVVAVVATQLLATAIALSGWLVHPIGIDEAALVWAFSLTFFLVNDRLKILTYRALDARDRRAAATA